MDNILKVIGILGIIGSIIFFFESISNPKKELYGNLNLILAISAFIQSCLIFGFGEVITLLSKIVNNTNKSLENIQDKGILEEKKSIINFNTEQNKYCPKCNKIIDEYDKNQGICDDCGAVLT